MVGPAWKQAIDLLYAVRLRARKKVFYPQMTQIVADKAEIEICVNLRHPRIEAFLRMPSGTEYG
jgi:hypothetical protein